MLEVINLRDGEILPHPLCLLRVVGAQEESTCAAIHNQSDDSRNGKLWKIHQGGFNALVPLVAGKNALRIICGTEELTIQVDYKPQQIPRFIRLVYITCLNEEKFQGPKDMERSPNTAVRKIRTGALVLQTFIAETLAAEGLGRRTVRYELDTEGNPIVHVIQLPLTIKEAHKFTEERLWETAALQILSSHLADKNCKYVAFFGGTRYLNQDKLTPKDETEIMSLTKGHVSLGGGGLALVGTGALYTWASNVDDVIDGMRDQTPVDKAFLMDFSAGRGTWGASYGTHLGSVLHELAHTLDLGHTPHGIMARGFEDLHVFFTTTKLTSDYLPQSPHHSSVMRQSMSSSLIKESVTFTTDFVRRIPLDNINMTVAPPKEPIASSGVYSPPRFTRRYPSKTLDSSTGSTLSIEDSLSSSQTHKNTCSRPLLNSPLPNLTNSLANNNKLQEPDGSKCRAFWARSSAVILAFHKWLNIVTDGEAPELKGSVVCSTAGIRVVELRDLHTMAFHHWEFVTRPPPPVLHLPWAQVAHWPSDTHIEVVAEDSQGNILKGCFMPRPL
nr:putative zinc metalloproteinase YIL108W [Penaeus vannamei]